MVMAGLGFGLITIIKEIFKFVFLKIYLFLKFGAPATWRPRRLPRSPMPGAGSDVMSTFDVTAEVINSYIKCIVSG